MSAFEAFKVGEYVAHITVGDGYVSSIEDGFVCVAYPRNSGKGPFIGKYDRRWFDLHPRYLFHRNASESSSVLMAETGQDPHRDM